MDYKQKYFKYKNKYLKLKGGLGEQSATDTEIHARNCVGCNQSKILDVKFMPCGHCICNICYDNKDKSNKNCTICGVDIEHILILNTTKKIWEQQGPYENTYGPTYYDKTGIYPNNKPGGKMCIKVY